MTEDMPAKERPASPASRVVGALGYLCFLLGSTTLLLILGHFLIGFALYLTSAFGSDPRIDLPVYDDMSAEDKAEFSKVFMGGEIHFEPYYHWKRGPFHSRYVNVDSNRLRRTIKDPDRDAGKVFVFGGSTVWGTGVRDEHTIPSLLQAGLGPRYDVGNYGEKAFTTVQEFNLLLRELSFGNIPDVVIFYDGVNDSYAGVYSPATPRYLQKLGFQSGGRSPIFSFIQNTNYYYLMELLAQSSYFRSEWDRRVEPSIPENALKTMEAYEHFVRQVKAVAGDYGFRAYFFWQPNLFSMTRKTYPHEDEIIRSESPTSIKAVKAACDLAKERLSGREDQNIFFLGDILNDVDAPLYIDWCHLGPRGNGIMADTIHKSIRKDLK